jgi:hypothetical protein
MINKDGRMTAALTPMKFPGQNIESIDIAIGELSRRLPKSRAKATAIARFQYLKEFFARSTTEVSSTPGYLDKYCRVESCLQDSLKEMSRYFKQLENQEIRAMTRIYSSMMGNIDEYKRLFGDGESVVVNRIKAEFSMLRDCVDDPDAFNETYDTLKKCIEVLELSLETKKRAMTDIAAESAPEPRSTGMKRSRDKSKEAGSEKRLRDSKRARSKSPHDKRMDVLEPFLKEVENAKIWPFEDTPAVHNELFYKRGGIETKPIYDK